MAQLSPGNRYHSSLIDQSNELLDATFHRTSSMQKNSSLFVSKKERQQAMKVCPYPPLDLKESDSQLRPLKSLRLKLGNVVFSKEVERFNWFTISAFSLLIYANFAFDSETEHYQTTIDFLSLSLIMLFALEETAKLAIIGCVSFMQPYLKNYWKVVDISLLVATGLSISFAQMTSDTSWDSHFYTSVARILRLTVTIRRISELKGGGERRKKEGSKQGFSVELASDKVRQILRTLLDQPWLHNNFELFRDVQWCIEVIESNSLSQAIVTVLDHQQGPQEAELISIVNQYSKSARRNSAMVLSRKSASQLPIQRQLSIPDAEMTDEVKSNLETVDSCEFDIFKLKSATKGNELLTLIHLFFRKKDLLKALSIESKRFSNYVSRVQSGYNTTVLYHTSTHAADVTQTFHYFLDMCDCAQALSLTPVEMAAGYLAAAVHDFEHPGLNNAYLVNTQSDLAIRYNDRSVLENHHVSAAFALGMDEEMDFFSDVPAEDYTRMRTLMIAMVLGTDVVNHFSMVSQFRTKFENTVGTSPEEKELCLEMLLHAADISNPTKPWPLCKKWAELVLNEFWEQGDKERELGLPMGYLTDRNTANVSKSQTGFIDVIVAPTYEALRSVFPTIEINITNLHHNREKWQNFDSSQLSTVRKVSFQH